MESTVDISAFAASLGLTRLEGDVFYGNRRGFAVGFKVINPLDNPLLLFQVRYPLNSDSAEVKSIRYDGAVEELQKEKQLEVEFDDRLAWITFVDGAKHLLEDSVSKTLDSILNSFTTAGLGRNSSLCHYCQREQVQEPSCFDGKVALICQGCLSERVNSPENRPAEATEGAFRLGVLASLAALVGGIEWAVFWFSFIRFRMESDYVPHLMVLMASVFAGFLVGGTVGLLIQFIQRRGRRLSMALSVISLISAVVLGEVGFIAGFIYRKFKVFSPSVAWEILPQMEIAFGSYLLAVKFLAACLAVGVALTMARPSKPNLKL